MTDHIPLPPPDHTEDVQGFVHDTQRHYYSEETMRAYAERLHAARVNSPAIMQAIGLLTILQSWIGPRRPENSEPEEQTLWDQIEATRIALTPLAPAGAELPANPMDWPLPCDVTVGGGTMRRGVKLSTLETRMKALYEMATGQNADEVANRTLAQRLALRDDFLAQVEAGCQSPSPAITPKTLSDADVLSMSKALMLQRLADAEDAARYRYLTRSTGDYCVTYADENGGGVLKAEAADAAIDAARSQAKEGGA